MPACTSENTTRVIVTMNRDLKHLAAECALIERRSLANLIVVALEEYIRNHFNKHI